MLHWTWTLAAFGAGFVACWHLWCRVIIRREIVRLIRTGWLRRGPAADRFAREHGLDRPRAGARNP